MVVKPNNMEKQVRSELKGGKGDIHFLNCVSKDTIPNWPALVLYDNSTGR